MEYLLNSDRSLEEWRRTLQLWSDAEIAHHRRKLGLDPPLSEPEWVVQWRRVFGYRPNG